MDWSSKIQNNYGTDIYFLFESDEINKFFDGQGRKEFEALLKYFPFTGFEIEKLKLIFCTVSIQEMTHICRGRCLYFYAQLNVGENYI